MRFVFLMPVICALAATAPSTLEMHSASSHRRFLLGQRFFEQKSSAAERGSACWHKAVAACNATCAEVLAMGPAKQTLALAFTNCHLVDSLRPPVPCASITASVASCTARMSDAVFALYTAFFTHADNVCFFLQAEAWQISTEQTIAALGREAAGAAKLMGAASRELGGVLAAQHALFALLANLRGFAALSASLAAAWALARAVAWTGLAEARSACAARVAAQVLLIADAGLGWGARELLLPHAAKLGGLGAAAALAAQLAALCRCLALPIAAVLAAVAGCPAAARALVWPTTTRAANSPATTSQPEPQPQPQPQPQLQPQLQPRPQPQPQSQEGIAAKETATSRQSRPKRAPKPVAAPQTATPRPRRYSKSPGRASSQRTARIKTSRRLNGLAVKS